MSSKAVVMMCMVVLFMGCSSMKSGNDGLVQSYPSPAIEAAWVRNGDPIIFEGATWSPVDDLESLVDAEVFQVGEYKGVLLFVDKVDVKPYERLYTKFAKNKYRYYERGVND